MTAPDLKPCPWCGHKPRMWEHHAGGCEIECVNGHCPSEPHVGMPTTAEAITAWNTRAPLADALAVPEVAREALMVERIDDVAEICRQFGLSEPRFRAALRAIGEGKA